MPSPSKSLVVVSGQTTNWLVSPQTELSIPLSLRAGGVTTLDGVFVFRANRPQQIPNGNPFTATDSFTLDAYMQGIERFISGFHGGKQILLQHPIKMNNLRHLKCLTPGQKSLIRWTVWSVIVKS
jgi:hypothetical protein